MRSSRRLTWGGSIINQSSSRARSCLRRTASTSLTMARRSSMRSMKCLCWTRPHTLEDIHKWVSLKLLILKWVSQVHLILRWDNLLHKWVAPLLHILRALHLLLQELLLLEEEDGVLHLLLHLPTSLKEIHVYRDEDGEMIYLCDNVHQIIYNIKKQILKDIFSAL